jgi:Cutinase
MKRINVYRIAACVAVAACGAGAAVAGQPAQAAVARPAAGSNCDAVTFIGVRGSGETTGQSYGSGKLRISGMGYEVDYLAYELRADLEEEEAGVYFKSVGYTAASTDVLKPDATVERLAVVSPPAAVAWYVHSSVDQYDASITEGIKQTEAAVAQEYSECPDSVIVMAGYSQGAAVVHDAENWLAKNKPAEFDQIEATLLLGDPDRVRDTKATDFGTAPASAEGLRVALGLVLAHDVPDPLTTAEIANKDDIVGNFQGVSTILHWKADAGVHTSYEKTAGGRKLLASAAAWAASMLDV